MQLQDGLVCAGELGGEAEDFEHDRVTLERRRRAAGPRPRGSPHRRGQGHGEGRGGTRGRDRSPVRRARRTARTSASARRAGRAGQRPLSRSRSQAIDPGVPGGRIAEQAMRAVGTEGGDHRHAGARRAARRAAGGLRGRRPGHRWSQPLSRRSGRGASGSTNPAAAGFASSQISRAVAGLSTRSIPKTRRSSRCDQTYSGLRSQPRHRGGPGGEPVPGIGITRDESLVDPGEAHRSPLVVVVGQPEVRKRLVDPIAGDVRRREWL